MDAFIKATLYTVGRNETLILGTAFAPPSDLIQTEMGGCGVWGAVSDDGAERKRAHIVVGRGARGEARSAGALGRRAGKERGGGARDGGAG